MMLNKSANLNFNENKNQEIYLSGNLSGKNKSNNKNNMVTYKEEPYQNQ